ncbi:hypothetical protein IQ22_00152 [Pseudomonas duriflava]|uniref:DNA polymerase III subunit chi n=1 Tax=Pseudomonas duriflava TaxID=459528 RepID=A0A562QNW0_9PSED|nr:DNA polymerase III subunit chi [Pseudomonas duriflava]TWI58448.1 hypothetical protein IQ22_00152 [Pseudomonas duriflava]
MDKALPPRPTHLVNDLESIREILDKENLPTLTDRLDSEGIPVLSDVVVPTEDSLSAIPPLLDQIEPSLPAARSLSKDELRKEAQLLLQEVIDDFVPQIEAELHKRLDARLDVLLKHRQTR